MSTSEAVFGIKSVRSVATHGGKSNKTLASKQPQSVLPPEKIVTKSDRVENGGDEELLRQAIRDYCKMKQCASTAVPAATEAATAIHHKGRLIFQSTGYALLPSKALQQQQPPTRATQLQPQPHVVGHGQVNPRGTHSYLTSAGMGTGMGMSMGMGIDAKRSLLLSLTPMLNDCDKQKQCDTLASEEYTRCRVSRGRTRLSSYDYTDLDTRMEVTPEEYENRYLAGLQHVRCQARAAAAAAAAVNATANSTAAATANVEEALERGDTTNGEDGDTAMTKPKQGVSDTPLPPAAATAAAAAISDKVKAVPVGAPHTTISSMSQMEEVEEEEEEEKKEEDNLDIRPAGRAAALEVSARRGDVSGEEKERRHESPHPQQGNAAFEEKKETEEEEEEDEEERKIRQERELIREQARLERQAARAARAAAVAALAQASSSSSISSSSSLACAGSSARLAEPVAALDIEVGGAGAGIITSADAAAVARAVSAAAMTSHSPSLSSDTDDALIHSTHGPASNSPLACASPQSSEKDGCVEDEEEEEEEEECCFDVGAGVGGRGARRRVTLSPSSARLIATELLLQQEQEQEQEQEEDRQSGAAILVGNGCSCSDGEGEGGGCAEVAQSPQSQFPPLSWAAEKGAAGGTQEMVGDEEGQEGQEGEEYKTEEEWEAEILAEAAAAAAAAANSAQKKRQQQQQHNGEKEEEEEEEQRELLAAMQRMQRDNSLLMLAVEREMRGVLVRGAAEPPLGEKEKEKEKEGEAPSASVRPDHTLQTHAGCAARMGAAAEAQAQAQADDGCYSGDDCLPPPAPAPVQAHAATTPPPSSSSKVGLGRGAIAIGSQAAVRAARAHTHTHTHVLPPTPPAVGAATVGALVAHAREGARRRLTERLETAQWQYRWELVGVEMLERRQRALLRQTTLAEGKRRV